MNNLQLDNSVSSPFFIHPNENPSLILVSSALTGSNYHSWRRSMQMALLSKNKFQFVDGSIDTPSKSDSKFAVWERCNTLVLSWILNSVSPSIAKSVLWFDTAFEVWSDLKDRFAQGDALKISELQEEIYSFRQNNLTVTDYFTQLKVMWDELMNLRPILSCSCDPKCTYVALEMARKYQENDHVIRFLKGLTESFAVVRSQILLMEPLPHINKVFSMVIQQERQFNSVISNSSQQIESHAFTNKAFVHANGGTQSRRFNSHSKRPL